MQQQRIPKNLKEGEDTLEFLAAIQERCKRKRCRSGGKRCGALCVNSRALCHIRLSTELNPALDRMQKFLVGRKAREAEVIAAAKDAIAAFKADSQWTK